MPSNQRIPKPTCRAAMGVDRLLGIASIGFMSGSPACARLSVALVTPGALTMRATRCLQSFRSVWLPIRGWGYGILDYPRTVSNSYSWESRSASPSWRRACTARAPVSEQFERRGRSSRRSSPFLAFAVY